MKFLLVVDGLEGQAKARETARELCFDVVVTDDVEVVLEQVDQVDVVVTTMQLKLSGGIQMFGGQPLYEAYPGDDKPTLGMAIALLAQKRGKPVVVVSSGSDVRGFPFLWLLFQCESAYSKEIRNSLRYSIFRWARDWSEALSQANSLCPR